MSYSNVNSAFKCLLNHKWNLQNHSAYIKPVVYFRKVDKNKEQNLIPINEELTCEPEVKIKKLQRELDEWIERLEQCQKLQKENTYKNGNHHFQKREKRNYKIKSPIESTILQKEKRKHLSNELEEPNVVMLEYIMFEKECRRNIIHIKLQMQKVRARMSMNC